MNMISIKDLLQEVKGVGWGPEFSYENNQYGGGRISKQSEEVLK